jgi:hypothetical protein
LTGLNPSQTYIVTVWFKSRAGDSAEPLGFTIRTLANAKPDVPEAPTVKLVGSNLRVSWAEPWNGNMPISNYHVKFQNKGGQFLSYFQCPDSTSNSCEFNFETLRNQFSFTGGDQIVAHVAASNTLGQSNPSLESVAIVLPRKADIASEITFEDVTGDSLAINFKPNEGISEYYINVERWDEATQSWVADQRIKKTVDEQTSSRRRLMGRQLADTFSCPSKASADTVSQEVAALEPGTRYRFEVEVAGTTSAPVEITTQMPATPSAPTNFNYQSTENVMTVFWNRPTGQSVTAQYLFVERVVSESQTVPVAGSPIRLSQAQSQYQITGLRSGTNYRVQIQAENNNGRGPKSNLLCAQTKDAAPDAVVRLEEDTSQKKQKSVKLVWS